MKSNIFEKEMLCKKLNKEFSSVVKESVDNNDLRRKSEEKEKEVSCLEEALGILEGKRKKLS